MNREDFDKLWERAEAESHATRLAQEYPAWRTRQRRTSGMAIAAAVLLAVAVPALAPHHSGYGKVYCNRTGVADNYWVAMADELLMSV